MRLGIFLLLSSMAFSQSWSGVLDTTRAVAWESAGAGSIPARLTICATIAPYTGNATAINNAIASCTSGQTVFLSAGTFHLSTGITFANHNNVTIRGAGADQTILIFTGNNNCGGSPASVVCIWNNDGNYAGSPDNTGTWTAGYSQGTTSVTLSKSTNLNVGSLLYLDQFNDTYQFSGASCAGGIVTASIGSNTFSLTNGLPIATVQGANPSGYNSPSGGGSYPVTAVTGTTVSYQLPGSCPGTYVSGGTITLSDGALTISNDGTFSSFHSQGNNPGRPANSCGPGGFGCRSTLEVVTVTGCSPSCNSGSSTVVSITPPIMMPNVRADRSPGAWWGNTLPASGDGVENMTLDATGVSGGNIVAFNNATLSWAKGLRTVFANSSHFLFWGSNFITVRDSYMYGNQGHGGTSSQSYCTDTYNGVNSVLVENNIYQHCAVAMQNEGGMGNVYGYNFSIDNDNGAASPPGSYPLQDGVQHAPGTAYALFEGNILLGFDLDDFHGNGSFTTIFRNRIKGWEPGKNTQTYAIAIQTGNRNVNIIGNVMGTSGFHNKYAWVLGTDSGTNEPACSLSILVTGFSGHCDSRIDSHNCDTNTCEIDDFRANLPNAANAGTTMAWGNYDTVNAAVRFVNAEVPSGLPIYSNAVPATHTLPSSFYGANYTAFNQTPWGTPPFPPIGPDVTGGNLPNVGGFANAIPAQLAFQNSSLDSAYTVSSSITGGSCTGSTATITIGGQASNVDTGSIVVVAGVTPSNFNCSDRTKCQVSAATSTTISYPVASCGGAWSSGGTAQTNPVLLFNAATSYAPSGGTQPPSAPAPTMFAVKVKP